MRGEKSRIDRLDAQNRKDATTDTHVRRTRHDYDCGNTGTTLSRTTANVTAKTVAVGDRYTDPNDD